MKRAGNHSRPASLETNNTSGPCGRSPPVPVVMMVRVVAPGNPHQGRQEEQEQRAALQEHRTILSGGHGAIERFS